MTEHPQTEDRPYLPGIGRHGPMSLYDPLVRLLGRSRFDRRLVEQAAPAPGHRVLEIGRGTGSVTVLAARSAPGATVTGLDPDPRALRIAARKARRAGVAVRWDTGFAQSLPYQDAAFDRVLSALMLHHLDPAGRAEALCEARRVLAPGGSLHVVDLGGAVSPDDGLLARHLAHSHRLASHLDDAVPAQLRAAGFDPAVETGHVLHRVLGRLTYYRGDVTADAHP